MLNKSSEISLSKVKNELGELLVEIQVSLLVIYLRLSQRRRSKEVDEKESDPYSLL